MAVVTIHTRNGDPRYGDGGIIVALFFHFQATPLMVGDCLRFKSALNMSTEPGRHLRGIE